MLDELIVDSPIWRKNVICVIELTEKTTFDMNYRK